MRLILIAAGRAPPHVQLKYISNKQKGVTKNLQNLYQILTKL